MSLCFIFLWAIEWFHLVVVVVVYHVTIIGRVLCTVGSFCIWWISSIAEPKDDSCLTPGAAVASDGSDYERLDIIDKCITKLFVISNTRQVLL